jgi:hypothetical protein
MNRLPRLVPWIMFALAVALFVTMCLQSQISVLPTVNAAVAGAQEQYPPDQYPPDQGTDPAAVNQAPNPDNSGVAPSGQSYTTEAPPPYQQAPAGQYPDDSNYAEQPTWQAPEAPPPLPEYDQPPPPADGYIWEPGYWAWGPNGYYWVPGAWVEPPYMGALWTPGYWGFYGGRYLFYPGHWGQHIGFYGGINYGFGYFGLGYEGGYWNSGRFFYNRVYTRVNDRVVHNVYSFHANTRVIINRGMPNREPLNRVENNPRPSFRGGQGGVEARPQPSEVRAWQEPTAPRMTSQSQHAENYSAVRGQYANENHGNPPNPAINRPLPADRNVTPQNRGGQQGGQQGGQNRGGEHQDHHR